MVSSLHLHGLSNTFSVSTVIYYYIIWTNLIYSLVSMSLVVSIHFKKKMCTVHLLKRKLVSFTVGIAKNDGKQGSGSKLTLICSWIQFQMLSVFCENCTHTSFPHRSFVYCLFKQWISKQVYVY